MYLEKISLINYRNYESLSKNFSAQINLLVGANAQGKTNILEAIYYLAIGKAYRSARENQLIKWGNQHFKISGEIKNKISRSNLEIIFQNENQFNKGNKEIKINGIKIRRMADFLGNLTAVLFAPEDLNIVKGSPLERRKLLDNDISQVNPGYFSQLQKYQKILNQRNHLLKRMIGREKALAELEIWNMQFLNMCEKIIQKRLQVVEKLTPLTRLMQRKLTGGQENLEFKYLFNRQQEIKNGYPIRDILITEMEKVQKEELLRGITLCGPHRDDLLFILNGINLKSYGSQGQHRTAVLAIKLAELEFFKGESGEYPLLLLDDVLSELDQERRACLIKIIEDKLIQCFITTTEDVQFLWKNKKNIASFYVEKGSLSLLNR